MGFGARLEFETDRGPDRCWPAGIRSNADFMHHAFFPKLVLG